MQIANFYGDRVEENLRLHVKAHGLEPFGQTAGFAVDRLGNGFDAVRPMIDRIHGGNHRQERLRGADIGIGFLAPNVLLAGLQRQAQRLVATAVH